ncbi:hypothetical protein BX616_008368 [Lobosporangium transversale]|nr:hypothetical protein BX616_008368 [Lobosporangium transversale]
MSDNIDNSPQLPWYRRLNQTKGLLLTIVSLAQMLDVINVASVTIVLPNVMQDVGFKFDQLQWVSSAYALAYGAFLLLGGRLGDLYGHRNIYILGVTWFSIWSIVNGFAQTPVVMSVGRALQVLWPSLPLLTLLDLRNKALGIFGGTAAVGSIVGVLLGGILGSTIGWRWMFYITAIIGFALVILGILVIPAEKAQGKVEDRRLDIFGMSAFTIGIVCVIYYLSEGPAAGWGSAKALAPFLVGIVLLIAFVVIEFKIDYPIMPLRIWQSRRFFSSCATATVMMAAMNAHFYFSALVVRNVLGYSALKTSVAFLPHGIGAIFMVGLLTAINPYLRSKAVLVVGWLFMIASGVLWAQIKAESNYWATVFPSLLLNMVAMVCIWLTCQINSVADAADEDQGVVGAVYNVFLQIGAPIGIAISNIVANKKNSLFAVGPELLPGYRDALYSFAIMGGVGLVVSLVLYPNRDSVKPASNLANAEVGSSSSLDEHSTAAGSEDKLPNYSTEKV